MTNAIEKTNTDSTATRASLPVHEVITAARHLAKGGRWRSATSLLDATTTTDVQADALLALAAVEVALECDWFSGTSSAAGRLSTAKEVCETVDLAPGSRWDLAFLRLRHDYLGQVLSAGRFDPGPQGKDLDLIADLRRRVDDLREQASDDIRRGWAEMYTGLVLDNVCGERDAAPAHYEAALRAGESGDDLLAREALRHLGDHDHDHGHHQLALERWSRATALGARAGAVPGTLSQQMLLAMVGATAVKFQGQLSDAPG
jgi:hypothetical protein